MGIFPGRTLADRSRLRTMPDNPQNLGYPRQWDPLMLTGAMRTVYSRAEQISDAVVDALSHLGVRHVDIPVTPQRVWRTLQSTGA